ncbi:MAG: hypothetical protein ACI4QM_04740 [Alphaproteobacteria bacterium]
MLDFIITHIDNFLIILSSVITTASALTALTPSPKDDTVILKVKQILDVLALNIGNAKRA